MSRELVEDTQRKAMTPARRKRILDRDGHVCRHPGCGVTVGLEVDHVVSLWMGGKEVDENLEALCSPHHKDKTAADAERRAKVKRLHKAGHGGREKIEKKGPRLKGRPFNSNGPKVKIPSRPFASNPRPFR